MSTYQLPITNNQLPGEPGQAEAILGTLLAIGPGSRVAVLVSRRDQVSLPLAALTPRLTTLTTDPTLAHTLRDGHGIPARVIRNLDDLPRPAEPFDVLIADQFLESCPPPPEPAPAPAPRDLVARAAALLRPGGALCLSVATPWNRAGWYRAAVARAAIRSGGNRQANRAWLRTSGEALTGAIHPPHAYRAALLTADLRITGQFAPFPGPRHPEFVVPLDDPSAAAYLFAALLPRPNLLFAALWTLAVPLARAGLLPLLAPHLYLLAQKPESA